MRVVFRCLSSVIPLVILCALECNKLHFLYFYPPPKICSAASEVDDDHFLGTGQPLPNPPQQDEGTPLEHPELRSVITCCVPQNFAHRSQTHMRGSHGAVVIYHTTPKHVARQTERNVESMCMRLSVRLRYLMTTYRYRSHNNMQHHAQAHATHSTAAQVRLNCAKLRLGCGVAAVRPRFD